MQQSMAAFGLCVLACAVLGAPGPEMAGRLPPVKELTLEQARQRVLEHQPAWAAAQWDVRAAAGRARQAAARPNPSLTLEAENFGGQGDFNGFDRAEYTAQIAQPLELGGKRAQRQRAATQDQRLADYDLEAQRLDWEAEATRRFVTVLHGQEQCALGGDFLILAEAFHNAVAARVRAGKVAPTEETKAEILLAQRKLLLDQAWQDLVRARSQLATLWGAATPDFERAAGTSPTPPPLPPLAAWLDRLPRNPDLSRWSAEIEQRRATLDLATAGRVPDLTVAGGVRHFSETDSQTLVVSVALPLPLFDRNQGRIQETQAGLAKAARLQRAAEISATTRLTETHQALVTMERKIAALKGEILPRAQTVFEAMMKGYQLGKFTYLEVLDAQRACFEARSEYLEALASYQQGRADLERLAGEPRQAGNGE
ncbi:MAG: TolC family protein [Kiritimatiellaeota bacterium]|nr:TolC family protein [Kiritimatiellota bacterium]